MEIVGVITAIRAEASCIISKTLPFNQMAGLGNDSVIWLCGMGHSAAREAATGMQAGGVTALVSFGVAGALDSSLRPGDLVLPQWIHTDGQVQSVDLDWRDRLKQRLPSDLSVVGGTLVTSREVLTTQAAKRELAETTGACAVDMESGAIAEVAASAGIPFLAIRAITDPFEFSPPAALLNAVRPDGTVYGLRLLKLLLWQSVSVSTLLRLGKGMRAACGTLSTVARHADKELGGISRKSTSAVR
ncbi:MAG: phosphorylase [Nitrosomonas sp.]|nr:phosphorylase [Nitrosomonas sp.]